LKYLIDFIKAKDIKKAEIFPHLKCSEEEAKILQYIVKKHIEGSESIVYIVLNELYSKDEYEYIEKLPLVKNLLHLGWLSINNLFETKNIDVPTIELINSSVTLSPSLQKLLEEGSLEVDLPKLTAYSDHLEYLRDQFSRIEIYQKIATIRENYPDNSLSIDRLKNRLKLLENRIAERVLTTSNKLTVEELFKEYDLKHKEQIIFLALLKEEYSSELDSLREMNNLINLISENDYEKIKNRSLLEEGATLIEKEIIDYDEMLTAFGGVTRSFFIEEDVLQKIMHPNKTKKSKKVTIDSLIKEQEIFELVTPKTTLKDVVLNPKTRELLDTVLKQVDKKVAKRLKEWGIKTNSNVDAKLIFYGPPGTGKTMTAYSLAKSLKRKVLSFDCSKILSMYVGESEKNVRKIFDTYYELTKKSKSHPILLLNEADQFLSSRSSGGSGAEKMHNQMQNIFLEQIEKFSGILIATTNLLETIDPAFSRRFDYKIEFAKPDFKQRVELWKKMLPKVALKSKNIDIEKLANYELSGGQISVVIKNSAIKVAIKDEPKFENIDFIEEINREIKGAFGEEKKMGFNF
jgi:SpoVK/Ycf46/Vps4 family AAA+-type ATPase